MKDYYKTIEQVSEGFYKEKGSKFYAYAFPVYTEEGIKKHLEELSKEHHSSRHVCYAWALGPKRKRRRENDAGEPSGTAGKPIYGQILSAELTNLLIIVVRYFGGTKLGTGGLINAYKTAAASALRNAKVVTQTIDDVYRVTYDYDVTSDTMRVFNKYDIVPREQDFAARCTAVISIRKRDSKAFQKDLKKISNLDIELLQSE